MPDPWQEIEDDLLQIDALARHARQMMAELGVTRSRNLQVHARRTWCQAIDDVLTEAPQLIGEIVRLASRSMFTGGRTRSSLVGHVSNELKRKAPVMGWKVAPGRPMRWYKEGAKRSPF
jgi:hypothetical protein